MLPPTHASRPLTSRASRATWAARRLKRPASDARPNASSRIRLAPNVTVSMRSAPASRYSRWSAATRSDRVVASSSRQARWGIPRENSSVPMPPSASSGAAARRAANRSRGRLMAEAYPVAPLERNRIVVRRRRPRVSVPSALEQHLGRRRAAVVGHRHRGRVGARPRRSRPGRRAAAAAGGGGRRCRCSRRSGRRRGRRWRRSLRPSASRPAASTGRPSEVSARIGWLAPYRAGRISSVMPASRTTMRSRLGPLADVEHARHEPAGLRHEEAARVPRPAAPAAGPPGRASTSARASRPKCSGVGTVPASPTGNPPPTSNVSNPVATRADQGEHRQPAADRVAPRVHGAQLRADVEVDPACAQRAVLREPGDRAGQLGLGHAELRGPAPDREAGVGLGRHVRVQAEQDVERGQLPAAQPGPRGDRAQLGELLGALDRDPAQRPAIDRRADGRPQVGRRSCRCPRA